MIRWIKLWRRESTSVSVERGSQEEVELLHPKYGSEVQVKVCVLGS